MTFGGHPITFKKVGDVVFVTCKGVTGTDVQIKEFLRKNGIGHFKFGESRIKKYPKKMVRIDCLSDTKKQIEFLYKQSQKLKDE